MEKVKIGVLVSGKGSNLQAIIDAINSKKIKNASIEIVISNRKDAYALVRAQNAGIRALFIDPDEYNYKDDIGPYSKRLLEEFKKHDVNLICLAGFLLKLSPEFISAFRGRILNIHPALLPAFGGKGMYGRHVHEAVLAAGVRFSGATVHFVDEEYDHGPIVMQAVVPVLQDDTPEALAERVLKEEHRIYPESIRLFCEGKLEIRGNKVYIKE
jgi:phosphoribosylglycinamide formyltransferase-1